MEWIFTIETISEVAGKFLKSFKPPSVYAFHGEMGAGKTTFITALCNEMGSGDTPGSPTYSIINEYLLHKAGVDNTTTISKVYHIDLYRLKDAEEAERAGVEDVLYSGSTCFAEWPERAPAIFPPHTIHVYIKALDEQTRLIKTPDI